MISPGNPSGVRQLIEEPTELQFPPPAMAILTEIPAENGADAAAQDRQIQPMEHEVQNNDNGRDHARVSFNSFFLSN